MGESTPLTDAINAVLGLAAADQQRAIVSRLRARAAEYAKAYGSNSQGAWALNMFAQELEEELAP